MEFQVRVSSECLLYLTLLKELYSKDTSGNITRGLIITRAFEESQAVTNWLEIYEDKHSIPLNDLEYKQGYGTKIKAEISDSVNRAIRDLKLELPKYLPTRSVTIGVTVRLICKAALLLNMNEKYKISASRSLDEEFQILEKELKELVAPINHEKLENILLKSKYNIQSNVK
ncbi:hypothetical protein [Streptococcus loxodontisalivarius]|uniref:Uncharacterized protein n=1 Tax=Streptococcus loxodontisalivarius TaxID=1349415 RepID=A0ABS2PVZ7_9STRE|nr:hypothetical protein [Streptococcus loxodontisalivarius]MBM7643624.1 hypothetical protein [Streptococcus loxodontisalivarius]